LNYYNEWDSFAAEWLRELIKEGSVPSGHVDERSIVDVEPKDLHGYTQCHFFAGIGGWSYALQLAGWDSTRPVWTGSPPCQPFSTAGKQKGKEDERHLWPAFFKLIRECKPPTVFGEQVASAIAQGWYDDLQDDMEAEGYATGMAVLPACSIGAPHKRNRLFFVADSKCGGRTSRNEQQAIQSRNLCWQDTRTVYCKDGKYRTIPTEPTLQPLANGVPNRVDILRGAGNAIVPQVAAEFIKAYEGFNF
jgi:DNA (cytosine-5)-methyltransferase 1